MTVIGPMYHRRIPFLLAEEITPSAVELPSDHFLCLSTASLDGDDATGPSIGSGEREKDGEGRWREKARPDISTLAAADYDVSVLTGFLPPQEPIRRLSEREGIAWDELESTLEFGQREIQAGGGVGRTGESFRERVRAVCRSLSSSLRSTR